MKGRKLNLVGRIALAGIALAGLVKVGGCGDLNPYQEQTLYNLTGLGYDYTMQQERNEAIRDSGREVNVNISNPQSNNFQNPKEDIKKELMEKKATLFTFNYLTDFNNNRRVDSIDELTGIKNKFRKDEKIILGSIVKRRTKKYDSALINIPKALNLHGEEESETRSWNIKIYNPTGKEIYNGSMNIPNFKDIFNSVGISFDFMNFLLNEGGLGNYKAALFLNGNFSDSHEFEITE